jgi:hypothetical protein
LVETDLTEVISETPAQNTELVDPGADPGATVTTGEDDADDIEADLPAEEEPTAPVTDGDSTLEETLG